MTIVNLPDQRKPDSTASYVQHLTASQNQLFAYIYSLIHNAEIAWDVLQETNMVLWRKSEEYDQDRPFMPWALGIAFQQVRAARTRLGRDRLVFHEAQTLESLTDDWSEDVSAQSPSDTEVAMEECVEKLSSRQQNVLEGFYKRGESLQAIASEVGSSANNIGVMLHRIRLALARCIDLALNPSANGEGQTER